MQQIDRLIRSIREMENPSALGLDTRIEYVPQELRREDVEPADSVFAYNKALLIGLRDILPAVKLQIAFYENMGLAGMRTLQRTIETAHHLGYVVIVDAKRGDIGSTAAAYSQAYLAGDAPFKADFLTVNPYFGRDGIEPFVDDCRKEGRGIFVLVKTSNPSSGEFQDLMMADGRPLYDQVADRVAEWGSALIGEEGYSSVAAVVGATYPEQGESLRRRMKNLFFLLPGYGAQGATGKSLVCNFDESGQGALVASSRGLICAHMKQDIHHLDAARAAAIAMRDDLRSVLRERWAR